MPGIGVDDLFDVLGRSTADTARHLHRLTGADPRELAADLDARFLEAVQREATPLPGALELLDVLQESDLPMALVSASARPVVDAALKVLGADRFRTTLAEGETPRTKPAADPYLAAARALGVDPTACLAVEDSPAGVAAAAPARRTVGARPPSPPRGGRAP
ncbi:HAD family hydrolase, partial [Streptomyces diastatochromogenes]|uniref:HAD family hydrolase n=1 Tax=Streptomyces diastatochromogenes TaxID=42236 RepID=UPI00368D5661